MHGVGMKVDEEVQFSSWSHALYYLKSKIKNGYIYLDKAWSK